MPELGAGSQECENGAETGQLCVHGELHGTHQPSHQVVGAQPYIHARQCDLRVDRGRRSRGAQGIPAVARQSEPEASLLAASLAQLAPDQFRSHDYRLVGAVTQQMH